MSSSNEDTDSPQSNSPLKKIIGIKNKQNQNLFRESSEHENKLARTGDFKGNINSKKQPLSKQFNNMNVSQSNVKGFKSKIPVNPYSNPYTELTKNNDVNRIKENLNFDK